MGVEAALALTDAIFFAHTGNHLSDLQSTIVRGVWQGKKYPEIADEYACTEGHTKDTASQLWKLLSEALQVRVTKSNLRTVIDRTHRQPPKTPSAPMGEPPNFVGRTEAIAHLNRLVQRCKVIVIQGEGGVGKTTLAQQYLEQEFEIVLELLMAKETENITSVASVVEEWLKQDFNEEPGGEFGVTLGRLKRQLENRRIGVLIDNLEPALDRQGKFISPHRRYEELLRVLSDAKVRSVTLITSRDRLCEPALTVEHYRLPGLDEQAWKQFFSFRQVQTDASTLKTVCKTYGGNAKAMGILCGAIREDFEGDLNAYWQENEADPLGETTLKNLVASQFNRLQSLDPEAYKLLCRLGCYRYQDVPTVPRAGLLALLWDVTKPQRLIKSLRDRSLVEFSKGQYWLHPVIRAEAVARLREAQWLEVHARIAAFWTGSVKTIHTVQDALTAFEAFHHYSEIKDFEQASRVILNSRTNQWGQFLPLGHSLYRLGLLQPVLGAIPQIIDRVQSSHSLSELYNILGDLYWITGRVREAIACQENAIATAAQGLNLSSRENQHQIYYLKMLQVDSLLSMGLYNLDLWELQQAASLFKQVIVTADTAHAGWAQKAAVCLALVHSYLGLHSEAASATDHVYEAVLNEPLANTGRFAYFIQVLGQTYANLGDTNKAVALYEQAIAFSQASHYTQVKAKSLTGLAEIHREQQLETAITHHSEAVELLEAIGAKCDLAQAYFQFGLTYQKAGETNKSQIYFQKAMQLFTQIKAPKQVEKVLSINWKK